jgi:hypothetical protein
MFVEPLAEIPPQKTQQLHFDKGSWKDLLGQTNEKGTVNLVQNFPMVLGIKVVSRVVCRKVAITGIDNFIQSPINEEDWKVHTLQCGECE